MMRCELTSDWTGEQITHHGAEITRCLAKYVSAYPEFETMENIASEIMDGTRQLWVIMEGDAVKSALLTEIEKTRATGKIVCRFAVMGGENGLESVPIILETVEQWAKLVHNADYCEMFGRRGWGKALQGLHYHEDKAIFRKSLQ